MHAFGLLTHVIPGNDDAVLQTTGIIFDVPLVLNI